MTGRIIIFLLTFIGAVFLLTTTASAYIDPATTAMLTQIIAGAFITLGVVFGVFRRKIIMFFKNMNVNRIKRKIEREAEKQNKNKENSQDIKQPDTNGSNGEE
ncbi:MAG: hypothetical protein FWD38_01110 [Oscillospiraceae bacterium]|nr:hypothetical protein [Oscillospiraceae bacterium]